jgi:hypothetical protein
MDYILNITGEFSKRERLYNEQGEWIKTKPLEFNEEPVRPFNEEITNLFSSKISPQGVRTIVHQLQLRYTRQISRLNPKLRMVGRKEQQRSPKAVASSDAME